MGDAAMAVEAVAVKLHRAIDHRRYGFRVAADAVLLHDCSGRLFGTDGVRDIPKDERRHVVIAGLGLDDIFRDQVVRGVAVVTVRPRFVPSVIPAFIDRIHHVTVIAGGWVVSQISGEVGYIHAHTDNRQ